jgi:hypothetical protein
MRPSSTAAGALAGAVRLRAAVRLGAAVRGLSARVFDLGRFLPVARSSVSRRFGLFAIVVALFVLWAGGFLLRSSFLLAGERHFVLFDDALVSMAYARNLLEGHGLVWQPGADPVEGFTNPLWTLALTVANLVPLPLRHRSLIVQIGGLVLLVALAWRLRALLLTHFDGAQAPGAAGWLPAVVLTLFHYGFVYWSLLGMEVALQSLLIVLAVHYAYDIVFREEERQLALFVVFALAFLLRMDMALAIAIIGVWIALCGGFRRRALRRWLAGAALFLGTALGYQLFRWLYYGSLLPNTYYLKLGGVPLHVRLPRGLDKLAIFLRGNAVLLVGVAASFAAGLGRGSRTLLPGMLILAYLAYGVWVGGDAWEPPFDVLLSRFYVFTLPLAFLLLNDLLNRALARAEPALRRALATAVTLSLFLLVNGLVWSPRAEANWRKLALIARPPAVESHQSVFERLLRFQELVAPDATVVTFWAGIPAYFAEYRLLDGFGYTDARTARQPLRPDLKWQDYWPGHAKSDPMYLLEQRPDAYFQFWPADFELLPSRWPRRWLRQQGYVPVEEFWLRADSPYLKPGALERATEPTPAAQQSVAPD